MVGDHDLRPGRCRSRIVIGIVVGIVIVIVIVIGIVIVMIGRCAHGHRCPPALSPLTPSP